MSIDPATDASFELLRQFANVWHNKYPQRTDGENRKPPSLTMRANGVAAVLTEPQLQAAVAGCERTLREMQAERNAANAELERLRDDNDALIKSCRRWMNQATVDFDRARDAGIELERMRAYTGPTVKIEWGVQDATAPVDPLNAVICDSREDARRDAERYSCEVLTNGKPTPHRVVTRLAGAWVEYEVADA